MQELSFDEFDKTLESDWFAALEKELKGKSPETLNWKDEDGLTHHPYHRPGHSLPFEIPSITSQWSVLQEFDISHHDVNPSVITALAGGVNAIGLRGQLPATGYDAILKGVILPYIEVHLGEIKGDNGLIDFRHYLKRQDFSPGSIHGSVSIDGLPVDQIETLLQDLSSFRLVVADARNIHSIGSSPVDDIVFCLSKGHEALIQMMKHGIEANRLSQHIQFNVSAGRSFFGEMAKLIALRILWNKISSAYGLNGHLNLLVSTSDFWQSGIDVENNLLRATSQSVSAICGGADVLHIRPYDHWKNASSQESLRWARNISHLLSDESGLESYRQAAHGSYLNQSLVSTYCDQAWRRFVDIEHQGGWSQLQDEFYKAVSIRGTAVQKSVADGSQVIVGVNKYQGKPDPHITVASETRASSSFENSGV